VIGAGGSGRLRAEFHQFLNIARRSTFENANVIVVPERRKLLTNERASHILDRLDHLCRKITNFKRTL
jgi:four helix bundle protein